MCPPLYHWVICQVIHRSPFLFGQFMEIHFVSLGLVSLFIHVSCYFLCSDFCIWKNRYLCLLYRLTCTGKYHQSCQLQYFDHLMRRADSFEKTPMLEKIEGRRRRRQQKMRQMASPTRLTWIWASSRSWWCSGKPGVLQSMGSQIIRGRWATKLNWG